MCYQDYSAKATAAILSISSHAAAHNRPFPSMASSIAGISAGASHATSLTHDAYDTHVPHHRYDQHHDWVSVCSASVPSTVTPYALLSTNEGHLDRTFAALRFGEKLPRFDTRLDEDEPPVGRRSQGEESASVLRRTDSRESSRRSSHQRVSMMSFSHADDDSARGGSVPRRGARSLAPSLSPPNEMGTRRRAVRVQRRRFSSDAAAYCQSKGMMVLAPGALRRSAIGINQLRAMEAERANLRVAEDGEVNTTMPPSCCTDNRGAQQAAAIDPTAAAPDDYVRMGSYVLSGTAIAAAEAQSRAQVDASESAPPESVFRTSSTSDSPLTTESTAAADEYVDPAPTPHARWLNSRRSRTPQSATSATSGFPSAAPSTSATSIIRRRVYAPTAAGAVARSPRSSSASHVEGRQTGAACSIILIQSQPASAIPSYTRRPSRFSPSVSPSTSPSPSPFPSPYPSPSPSPCTSSKSSLSSPNAVLPASPHQCAHSLSPPRSTPSLPMMDEAYQHQTQLHQQCVQQQQLGPAPQPMIPPQPCAHSRTQRRPSSFCAHPSRILSAQHHDFASLKLEPLNYPVPTIFGGVGWPATAAATHGAAPVVPAAAARAAHSLGFSSLQERPVHESSVHFHPSLKRDDEATISQSLASLTSDQVGTTHQHTESGPAAAAAAGPQSALRVSIDKAHILRAGSLVISTQSGFPVDPESPPLIAMAPSLKPLAVYTATSPSATSPLRATSLLSLLSCNTSPGSAASVSPMPKSILCVKRNDAIGRMHSLGKLVTFNSITEIRIVS